MGSDSAFLFHANPNPMWMIDIQTLGFIEVNAAAVAKYGYTRDEFLAMNLADIRPQTDVARFTEILRSINGATEYQGKWKHRLKDGSIMDVEVRTTIRQIEGRLIALATITDITDQIKAQENDRYLATILKQANDAVISTDLSFVIRSWNRAAELTYGWSAEEVVGRLFSEIVPTSYLDSTPDEVVAEFYRDGFWKGEVIQYQRDGTPIDILSSVALVRGADGEPVGAVGINRDIRQRKHDETILRQQSQRLAALSQQLVETQEAERRLIARELHDEIGQSLTVLNLLISSMNSPQAGRTQALHIIGDLIQRVRDLSLDLRPTMLDDLGLLPTLDWHLTRFTQATNIVIDFRESGGHRRFESCVETTLYRVTQEALTNIARHADVKTAAIRLRVEDEIKLQIEDQGKGFDLDVVLQANRQTNGVTGIFERVRLVGGVCTIETSPGNGTFINIHIPLNEVNRA